MAEFSEIVYRGFGPHQRKGGGFSTLGVRSEDELAEALADGWFRTLPEAIDAHDNKKPKPAAETAKAANDDAPPSRAEIETKCRELGIKPHHKQSDAKLLLLIDEALAAKVA